MPIRWVDEWDNADGSIERGYAGRSIFFEDGNVRDDLAPVSEYARLLASVGINGCNVNNVNGAAPFLDAGHASGPCTHRRRHASLGRAPRLISVDIASPQKIGGLNTYDPLDPDSESWWAAKVNEIYALIPDFAGFTVKADSEGQPGPASYGRTPADAANTLAAALAPHGGVVLYRAFVYNHHLDWQRSQGRPRPRRLRHLSSPRRQVRAQRDRADQGRPHRLPGARAGLAALRRTRRKPARPWKSRSRRSTPASSATSSISRPCGREVLDFDMRVDGAHTPVEADHRR